MPRTLVLTFLGLIFLALPALARQVTEWRSTSGSTVRMIGTENMQFQIQILAPDGSSYLYDAWWVEVRNTFAYNARGQTYQCNYCNQGWSILSRSNSGTYRWDFVRWVER